MSRAPGQFSPTPTSASPVAQLESPPAGARWLITQTRLYRKRPTLVGEVRVGSSCLGLPDKFFSTAFATQGCQRMPDYLPENRWKPGTIADLANASKAGTEMRGVVFVAGRGGDGDGACSGPGGAAGLRT